MTFTYITCMLWPTAVHAGSKKYKGAVHTESIFTSKVWNFCTLKINTTSCCVKPVYTLPQKLSSVIKKCGLGLISSVFHICCMHFERKGWRTRKKKKRHVKNLDSACKDLKGAVTLQFSSNDFRSYACECVRLETQLVQKVLHFAAFQSSRYVNSDPVLISRRKPFFCD